MTTMTHTDVEVQLLRARPNREQHVRKQWHHYVSMGRSRGLLDGAEGL